MISSRRLAREWALKILYQTEHVTPGAQPVFDRLLGEVTRAEQRSRQRLMREAHEIALAALQSAQEGLERDITLAGYSYTEARELIAGLNAPGGRNVSAGTPAMHNAPAVPPVPAVVVELAQASALVSSLLASAQALPSPLRGEVMDAYLADMRIQTEGHISGVRARLQSEVVNAALDRLRLEFVQRGSRTASGSTVEQACLDATTADLRDTLPTLRRPLEQAAGLVLTRLLGDAPYWQETRTDRLFREPITALPPNTAKRLIMSKVADAFNLTEGDVAGLPALRPPRLLATQLQSAILPNPGMEKSEPNDGLNAALALLTPDERARLGLFTNRMRHDLPDLLDNDLRLTGLTFVRELVEGRPSGASHAEMQEYLRQSQDAFNRAQAERWRKVAAIVEKQMGDWLRTASFALRLVQGVGTRQKEIDATITGLSAGWRMDRQVAVDRNILRIGGYELLYVEGVPAAAAINEAVELAKKYSTTESGRFVNGVLGALAALPTHRQENAPDGQTPDGAIAALAEDAPSNDASSDDSDDTSDMIDLPDDMDDVDLDTPVTEEENADAPEDEQ